MNRFLRITLKLSALGVALVALSHFAMDWHATRRLEVALDRLRAPLAKPHPSTDQDRRGVAGLVAVVASLEAALSDEQQDVLRTLEDDPPPTLEALDSVVAALAPTFAALDRLPDTPIRLSDPTQDRTLDLIRLVDVVRACRAGVVVSLGAGDIDAAAEHVRRMARCADLLEPSEYLIQQLVRFSLISRSCAAAREVLVVAPNPAALGGLGPKPPSGAIKSTRGAESELVARSVASGLDRHLLDIDAILDSADHESEPSFEPPFVGPWFKYGIAQFCDYLRAAGEHFDPTPENVAWLRQHTSDFRVSANSFGRQLAPDLSSILDTELRTIAEVAVLRAGASSLAQFRERGIWPPAESLGGEVKATRISDRAFEVTSAVVPEVSWKIEIR